jgi:predicted fused transcriptional regulator/phosphomethylpyrimidine kinase
MNPSPERAGVIERLERAKVQLQDSIDRRLIPSSGLCMVYAIRGARDPGGVAGMTCRITRDRDNRFCCSPVSFGIDETGARIILTAMKSDPVVRSVAILHFTPSIIEVLGKMFLECCSFDRLREPAGLSTMDWGVASCCRDGVPDVIFDTGTPDQEGLVRLFGENPDAVANNIIILSNRILNIEI